MGTKPNPKAKAAWNLILIQNKFLGPAYFHAQVNEFIRGCAGSDLQEAREVAFDLKIRLMISKKLTDPLGKWA